MGWRIGQSGHVGRRVCSEELVEDVPRLEAGRSNPANVDVVVLGYIPQPYFLCPTCERPCRHLYGMAELRCRRCHSLDYRCRHEGSDPAARVTAIRHALGAQPGVGSPVPPRPRTRQAAKHYDWLLARLVRAEGAAARDVKRLVRGAQRYVDEAKSRPRE